MDSASYRNVWSCLPLAAGHRDFNSLVTILFIFPPSNPTYYFPFLGAVSILPGSGLERKWKDNIAILAGSRDSRKSCLFS